MRPIECVLALWRAGLMDSESVVRWADQAILAADIASQELIDLACDGPATCLRRAEVDFPARAAVLDFTQAFALRALAVQPGSETSTRQFSEWAARGAMGEDLDLPEVQLGYRLDHLLVDCEDPAAAVALVREALPGLRDRCTEIAVPFLPFI